MNALLATASLLLAASPTPGWDSYVDTTLGVELLRPTGWNVEALNDDTVVVKATPPLQGSTLVIPLRAPGVAPKSVVYELAARMGAKVTREKPVTAGWAALVQVVDAASPDLGKVALVSAWAQGDKMLVYVVSAPAGEFAAARPSLSAIAQSVKFMRPEPKVDEAAVAQKPLLFEPFREPGEKAFSGELPEEWERDLSVGIVQGASPYVKASAIGRSPDNLYAFVHYKLASFQVPVPDLTPQHPGYRYYEAGAFALERFLFPAVQKKDPKAFGEWRITRKGGVQVLFYHPSGVRFDGEDVDYEYRYKGELLKGHAFVVTYHLPQEPSPVWYLYGLFGYEAPPGREATARRAATQLVKTFTFEGRYAPQADMFWTLARDAALKALSAEPAERPTTSTPHRAPDTTLPSLERAAASLTEVKEGEARKPVYPGVSALFAAEGGLPAASFKELEALK